MTTDLAFPSDMKIIGVVGGVASGKSFVARCLEELGAGRLDADSAGHEVLREPDVEDAARARWGDEVFAPEGRIDRAALAKRVFLSTPESAEDLAYLEQVTHPRIAKRLRDQAFILAQAGRKVLVLDAPVLLKAGWDRFCTHLLFVDSTLERRQQRAAERGWKAGELAAREAVQDPLERKRSKSTIVVDNSGTAEETKSQLARIWPILLD
ncbi:MAG: dephospho-CoA kinase [Planctomycetia bacterium]|nr:dephospho-CoA kinase [Planctomycetia bacterium]